MESRRLLLAHAARVEGEWRWSDYFCSEVKAVADGLCAYFDELMWYQPLRDCLRLSDVARFREAGAAAADKLLHYTEMCQSRDLRDAILSFISSRETLRHNLHVSGIDATRAVVPISSQRSLVNYSIPANRFNKVICVDRREVLERLFAIFSKPASAPLPLTALLYGGAGNGKSWIARSVLWADDVMTVHGSRRYFVSCYGAVDTAMLGVALCAELGLGPVRADAVISTLYTFFDRLAGPSLLALDGLDTVYNAGLASKAALEDELLPALARCTRLLVTFRSDGPLLAPPDGDEWTVAERVSSLELPHAKAVFLSHARLAADTVDADLDSLLDRLQGHALSISLLAKLRVANNWTIRDILAKYDFESYRAVRDPDEEVGSQGRRSSTRVSSLEISIRMSLEAPPMEAAKHAYVLCYALSLDSLALGCERDFLDRLLPDATISPIPPPLFEGNASVLLPTRARASAIESADAGAVLRRVGLVYEEAGRLRMLAPLRAFISQLPSLAAASPAQWTFLAGADFDGVNRAARRYMRASHLAADISRKLAEPAKLLGFVDRPHGISFDSDRYTRALFRAEERLRSVEASHASRGDWLSQAEYVILLGEVRQLVALHPSLAERSVQVEGLRDLTQAQRTALCIHEAAKHFNRALNLLRLGGIYQNAPSYPETASSAAFRELDSVRRIAELRADALCGLAECYAREADNAEAARSAAQRALQAARESGSVDAEERSLEVVRYLAILGPRAAERKTASQRPLIKRLRRLLRIRKRKGGGPDPEEAHEVQALGAVDRSV